MQGGLPKEARGHLKLLQYPCSYPPDTSMCIFKKIKEHKNAVLPASLLLSLKPP